MKFFDELSHFSPNRLFVSMVLGVIAGISYAMLIPIVTNSLQQPHNLSYQEEGSKAQFWGVQVDNENMALLFFLAIVCILICQTVSQVMLALISSDVTRNLRIEIYKKVLRAKMSSTEQVGSSRLMASLTSDVQTIVGGAKAVPDIIVSLFTLLGMLIFLLYLQVEVFVFVIQCIFLGVILYQVPMFFGNKAFFKSRKHVDNLHDGIRSLSSGIKELKLNKNKKDNFVETELLENEDLIIENQKLGLTIITAALNFGNMIALFVLGIVAFVFVNYHQIDQQTLIAVFMVLLYVTGPIGSILNGLPSLMMANISYQKMQTLLVELEDEGYHDKVSEVPAWSTFSLTGVLYNYDSGDNDRQFSVGPVDLTFKKGEVTYIVGGNGSGKSTLSKLITLHYQPAGGQVLFDSVPVDVGNANSYRQMISAIYSDFHLFETVLDSYAQGEELQLLVNDYLVKLDLADKVTFSNGRFSTLKLSDGQRKRLALLNAYLEDKDMYLFDEWAADQDPEFREIFYTQLLTDLKSRGKLVIVITHDDQYFDQADRLIRMDKGKVVSESTYKLENVG
ncbi:cyclic peptide export ABC transporter [Pseudoalteromonas luteoviolacea]|uniref:cyclic peptide export ABC transporter n=1 Tax=Pseudoalteromonas luteoviolacea TaxID=43657 RepID=UPI001EED02EA|nr:cyclic peptide export ABC transporter [Pseudoalteromonas luteoviolacea]MCF6437896.1 cyclic peptide export ABC transporter [Pseudoalteromonas luteoviolacea]